MTDIIERTLYRLRAQMPGRLSRPGDHRYGLATSIWAKPARPMPRAIVHCRAAEEVQIAIQAARDSNLPLSVRGGGHDWAGRFLCDGIVIDLSGHVRRKFYELHVNGSSELATETVATIAKLWQIEDEARGQAPEVRVRLRRQNSATVLADLFDMWEKELPRISGKSKLAEAIRYALARRVELERFLADGRIEIDSNIVERAIRPQTITRKNSLFAGSDGGGRTWATIATMLQTAKMNRVDPYAWLKETLERLAQGWPINQIDNLMPWNFRAPTV